MNRASGPTVIYKNGQRFVNYVRRGDGIRGNFINLVILEVRSKKERIIYYEAVPKLLEACLVNVGDGGISTCLYLLFFKLC
ncbi:hypothetical protein BLX87_08600 [Bacillus sp. VT-16-64]|nr:hypothetical protein BLX87_08600 [Bacillus sp. VT-16-64]